MIVTNANGRAFFVRVVMQGERYGLEDRITHKGTDPLIEFFDYKTANQKTFGPRGQFVSRYLASTLADHLDGAGLCLAGGVSAWAVDGEALAPVVALARTLRK